ncbi:unnamed protein product [Durusdinium trenchii]|uniref:NADH:ubiquinone reductase (non-electrogenic) n=2 Tax=Durusdinium trenchii TaxID=1381693 RepID=A0ABP0NU81_9DINO
MEASCWRQQHCSVAKVVVLGSGWRALSFARKLDPSAFDVTVVSPRPFFFYTPLLVGSTTGIVSPGAIIEPIRDNVPKCDSLRVHCKDVDLESKKAGWTGVDICRSRTSFLELAATIVQIGAAHVQAFCSANGRTLRVSEVEALNALAAHIRH